MKQLSILGLCILALPAIAQKLPGIQKESLKAQANVKIDGKLSEWSQFQAYNNATGVYYSVANDANNLYLVIQARDSQTVRKIIGGGITFTIMPGDQKSNGALPSVTFPLLKSGPKNTIGLKYSNRELISKDAAIGKKQTDSLTALLNTEIDINSKEIKLAGMKDQTDSLISVYNGEGYKAVLRFDQQFALNYELAIPLAVLGITAESGTFGYKISINKINFNDSAVHRVLPNGQAVTVSTIPYSITGGPLRSTGNLNTDPMFSTTDCKGSYTLVK